jgi:hypothetical protein
LGWINRLTKENSAFKLYVFKKDYDLSRIAPKEFILDLDFKPGGCDNFNSFHTKYTNRVNKPEEKRSSINSVKLNTFGNTECDKLNKINSIVSNNKIDLTKLPINEQLVYMRNCWCFDSVQPASGLGSQGCTSAKL